MRHFIFACTPSSRRRVAWTSYSGGFWLMVMAIAGEISVQAQTVSLSWPTDARFETGVNIEASTNAGSTWSVIKSNLQGDHIVLAATNPQPAVPSTNILAGQTVWAADCTPYNQFRASFNLGTTNVVSTISVLSNGLPWFTDYWAYAANFKLSISYAQ